MVVYGGRKLSSYDLTLLRKMYVHAYIGRRRTDENSVVRGFPKHDRKNVRKALKLLVRLNLVIECKSTGQTHVSLNLSMISEIKKIIEEKLD